MADESSDVLFVCTAGIVRSPLAAALLDRERRARRSPPGWRITSAGVHAQPGQPVDPVAWGVALEAGIDLSEHRSRRMSVSLLSSTLILTMTERHRIHLVRATPQALPRIFTLVEFLRLSAAPCRSPGGLEAAAAVAHRARAHTSRASGPEDIADPHGGPRSGYEATLAQLVSLIEPLADRLLGPEPVNTPR